MLPAAVLLLLFLTYPLGLGVWLGFTDAKVGRAGRVDRTRELRVPLSATASRGWRSSTRFSTPRREHAEVLARPVAGVAPQPATCRFKTFFRAVILLPYIVPTALSAIAFWWIYDAQFSIISWALLKLGLIDHYIDFLGEPWNARLLDHRRQRLARHSLRRDHAAGRAADDLALALRGLGDRRRHALAAIPLRHAAAAHADHRGGDDLLGALHLHRFPADLRAHARRPAERDPPDGDALVPARHLGRRARRRRGDLDRHGAVPAGGDPVQLLRPAAAGLAARERQD